ncbi:MAG: FG-GAP repeat protein [Pyrinomonadaceae bacterium]
MYSKQIHQSLVLSSMILIAALSAFIFGYIVFPSVATAQNQIGVTTKLSVGNFTQQTLVSTGVTGDSFAGTEAISGDTAVVASNVGFYVYTRSGANWTQQTILVPSDGMAVVVGAPFALTISGSTVVIGGRFANINGHANQGAAYVFVRIGNAWTEQQRLTATDGVAGDAFGNAVSISGNNAVIGASSSNGGQGAAYVDVRSGLVGLNRQS